ncbi:conserved hypothetical protein [Ixodes scapularis]|uniref:Neurotransmitter-gated ion-channel ligand-binding domain-containing protein n=2 Tax=Ixodes scapularis TaxID=6945 RepID=B7Q0U2_IXOSC|nr:conserved hypothetical protein [Ixodes scapularis]|eukprot:XP_002408310.1 conserved hypothetical protein [Ixodes scapularis]
MYCTMDLFYYPVDTSLCDLSIINVESDDNEFVLRWIGDDRSPFRASKKSIDFDPKRGTTSDSFVFFPALPLFLVDDLADGKFAFQRKLLGIMMDPLVPSVFPVVLSWTGFWLGPHAAKTRAILVSLCMVLQTFQQSGFVAPRHHNRHIQTVDVWFVACHVFIIASLLELVLVSNAVRLLTSFKHYPIFSSAVYIYIFFYFHYLAKYFTERMPPHSAKIQWTFSGKAFAPFAYFERLDAPQSRGFPSELGKVVGAICRQDFSS